MRHASLLQAVAVGIATLQPLGAQVCAQTAVQAEGPSVEWTFEEVVRTAIAQHPLVEAARDRISAAGGARRTAASLSNPIATYWIEHGAAFPGPSVPLGSGREASTYVTMPLEPFFQRGPRIRRADADVKSAEIALLAARRQVALDAAHAFYRVAVAQVSRQVADENRVGLERLVSYNRSRVTEGAAAELELIRVQVELDRAATEVVLAEIDLVKSRADLWPFLNTETPGTTPITWWVAVPRVDPTLTLAPLTTFATRARTHRPEVLSAAARVSAATAEAAVQRAMTVRQVGATFGFKRVEGGNSMIAGISMPVPLFDRNRGEIQRATAELVAAQHELAWNERAVAAEIEGAYNAAQRLSAHASMLNESFLDRADEASRITLGAYQEGGATLLQVLDAARSAADARLMYYRVVFAQRQSVFDLAVAAGDEPEAALSAWAASVGQSVRTFGSGRDRVR